MKSAMQKIVMPFVTLILVSGAIASLNAHSQETKSDAAKSEHSTIGGQASLRGLNTLEETREADPFMRTPNDRSPYISDYVYQPPLIPHKIRGYEISTNANKCLSCHSFRKARDSGATKISVTHYGTRQGQVLSDVSPRRYFCLQCHVTQTDTVPLIENKFERVNSLQQP